MAEPLQHNTLKTRYDKGTTARTVYLNRARAASELTIPTLIPPQGANPATVYQEPNQSIGADGINNLSAKLTLTLLPPNSPFYKFGVDTIQLRAEAEAAGREPEEEEKAINEGLSKLEQYIKDKIEADGDRVVLGESLKHLLVGGNVFMVDDKEDGLKYYPLSRYIVKRTYNGSVIYAITTESVSFSDLPQEVKDKIKLTHTDADDNTSYNLYTVFERSDDGKKWSVYSEVEGVVIESTRGSYPIDRPPFVALRYTRIDGEDYGRGFIEEYIGDLRYLDQISKAIKEASLAASKFIVLVDPSGVTKASRLQDTKNGGYCVGREQDVSVLQANKYYDLKTAESISEKIEQRLNRVFLLSAAAQRDSERTTATEVEFMIKELNEGQGNFYSILSREFQKPYLTIKFHHLKQANTRLPDVLKDKNVRLTITTGLEALGRSNDMQKMSIWIDLLTKGAIIREFGGDLSSYGDRCAASLGLDVKGILPTKEEAQAQQEQAQKAEMLKTIAPGIIGQAGGILQNGQKIEGERQNGTEKTA